MKTRTEYAGEAEVLSLPEQNKLKMLLEKETYTEVDLKMMVDMGGELDAQAKELAKKVTALKNALKEQTIKDEVTVIGGDKFVFKVTGKNEARITVTPTQFVAFIKKIGKIDVVDAVLSVPITNLKKYVDIHTLETEGILVTDYNPYGSVSFKKKDV